MADGSLFRITHSLLLLLVEAEAASIIAMSSSAISETANRFSFVLGSITSVLSTGLILSRLQIGGMVEWVKLMDAFLESVEKGMT